jgi:glycosyltransferase involved in cell wall biosynthesis
MPEVTGDAAIAVDPASPGSIAAAMKMLVDEPNRREALRRRGQQRAQLFSWTESARKLIAAYHETLRLPPRPR